MILDMNIYFKINSSATNYTYYNVLLSCLTNQKKMNFIFKIEHRKVQKHVRLHNRRSIIVDPMAQMYNNGPPKSLSDVFKAA